MSKNNLLDKTLKELNGVDALPKIEAKGYKPHGGQLRIHKAIDDPRYKYIVVCNGRQWGKTLMVINQIYKWAFNEPGSNIYYIAPTFKLSNIVYNIILNHFENSGLVKHINKTSKIFTFHNKSTLSFHSSENPHSMRGATLTHCVVDEMAFCKDPQSLWTVLQPALLVKGRKVVFISTPFGKNFFYDLYLRGMDNKKNPKWISFTSPSWENPRVSIEEILEEKKNNELKYRVEYAAEFIDDALTIFKNVKECTYYDMGVKDNKPDKNERYVMGVDIATKFDYTVAFVMSSQKKIVDSFRINYTSYEFIKKCLKEMYDKWKPVNGFVEINHNPSVYEDLKAQGCKRLQPIHTSYSSKKTMIEDLIVAFENKSISVPNLKYLEYELSTFTFTYNKTSQKITYNARAGYHDDSVMALAMCLSAWKDDNPTKKKFRWSTI